MQLDPSEIGGRLVEAMPDAKVICSASSLAMCQRSWQYSAVMPAAMPAADETSRIEIYKDGQQVRLEASLVS